MYTTIKIGNRRNAFTLVEMLVVIAIIITIAALAAAFAPRVDDSQKLWRAVDNLEQWLLTAKMRAKRDGLATGLRFVQAPPGDAPGTYSQFQYIQQPDPLAGYPGGPTLVSAGNGTVTFSNVDFSLGGVPYPNQWLVQPGDYLEVNGGGVYYIAAVTSPTTIQLGNSTYDTSLSISTPTTNFRILRQPRILIGEEPLTLPNNYAVDMTLGGTLTPGPTPSNYSPLPGTTVPFPATFYDIVFSPSGAVVGANAGNGIIEFIVHDMTIVPVDLTRAGIIGIQCRTGFIGAYDVAQPPLNPFAFVQTARESGL